MATLVTKTIKSSGGDYTTLVAFESGMQGDFVALDQIVEGVIFTPSLTTACTFSGSTTDATRYWSIRADATTKHLGVWDDAKAKYTLTNSSCIAVSDGYFRIKDMQLQVRVATSTRVNSIATLAGTHVFVLIENCLFREDPASSNNGETNGYYNQSGGGDVVLRNCIAMGFFGGSAVAHGFSSNSTGTRYMYNCTAYNCQTGFLSGTTTRLKNCLAVSCAAADFSGSVHADTTNCVSSDATAPGTSPQINKTVTFINAAGYDCHLDPSDTGATGFGADLSADPDYPFSTDIDGDAIVGAWSAGADWNMAAAAGGPKSVLGGAILKGTVLR